ncbi:MAG: HlyD family efflux transporter periplasmic adaptor subunit [Candidatus Muirbacterium halophilum]|nr:HlyD family efflux transporter periplasmic adaptor subunit [Candidatus Muirbacterium halophilum]MCK9474977.1 HlyD family efflux transporter periplasmic adaptor subunit [Candidatus Muirbacterium halophilum]
MKNIFTKILISFLFILVFCGCGEKKHKNSYTLNRQDFRDFVLGKGEFVPVLEQEVNVPMGIWSTVSFLEDEGKEVKKDDIIAEFDTQDIKSRNIWSLRSLERNEINLKKTIEDNIYEFERENKQYEIALMRKELFLFKNKLFEKGKIKEEIENAKKRLEITKLQFDFEKAFYAEKEKMFKAGYISQLEIERFRNNLKISQYSYENEISSFNELANFPSENEKKLNDLNISKSVLEFENTSKDMEASRISRELNEKSMKMRIERSKKDSMRVEDRIKKSTLKSPIDGVLMYVTGWDGKIRVGGRVWSGMSFLKVTDFENLKIRGNVSQKDIERLKDSMEVEIFPIAFPGKVINGKLIKIGKLGKLKYSSDEKGVKEFEVEIEFEGELEGIKPNFSAEFRIFDRKYKNVFVIPKETVIEDENGVFVNIINFSGIKKTKIDFIGKNSDYYFVEKGLSDGQKILFNF